MRYVAAYALLALSGKTDISKPPIPFIFLPSPSLACPKNQKT